MKLDLLVVDDEPNQRQLLAGHVREQGQKVREAMAAEEALQMLEQSQPDLVLTDVRLPGADGVELIRNARARGMNTEFLVMTAVEAMRAGAYDYLTKPIGLGALGATCRTKSRHRPAREGLVKRAGRRGEVASLSPRDQAWRIFRSVSLTTRDRRRFRPRRAVTHARCPAAEKPARKKVRSPVWATIPPCRKPPNSFDRTRDY